MSKDGLRVKVAELCGYEVGDLSSVSTRPKLCIVGKDGKHWMPHEYAKLPDYPNDLNAMHEAEKIFADNVTLGDCYIAALLELSPSLAFATAEQRCLAFVKTMEATAEKL